MLRSISARPWGRCDAVKTNTFDSLSRSRRLRHRRPRIRELSLRGTELAREVADEIDPGADGIPRFVLGSIGPGTQARRWATTFDVIRDAYQECAAGMLGKLGPTRSSSRPRRICCRSRPPYSAAAPAMEQLGRAIPIITHVSVETC